MAILPENNIMAGNIAKIILTHRHPDHCGLAAILAGESGAQILVHANFRSFVEGEVQREMRPWLGSLDPSQLRGHNFDYLSPARGEDSLAIANLDFPRLRGPIALGTAGQLDILACPESPTSHSPDQLLVLYSPRPHPSGGTVTGGFLPTNEIIFAGDLWLMHAPLFSKSLRHYSRKFKSAFSRLKGLLSGNNKATGWDPRSQDTGAKEALKRGFCLIRVKPGHGEEFLGTRLIPHSLFAGRDILLELGYSLDADKSLLKTEALAPKVYAILENAHSSFKRELLTWLDLGYDAAGIAELLARIYREQVDGGKEVAEDRRERRVRLKQTLRRLQTEEGADLRQIAELTLPKLSR